ncbi:hypothetical protein VTK56DRAFT_1684 [Thermocarpiscus australiensis]
MHLSVVVLSLLATAFAAPTDKVEARQFQCDYSDECYAPCAAGSIYIDCGASWCNQVTLTCVCDCHY